MDYSTLKKLVAIDSPSGYSEEASRYIFKLLKAMGGNLNELIKERLNVLLEKIQP